MYYKAHYYNALLEYVAGNLFWKLLDTTSHHFDLSQVILRGLILNKLNY